MNTKAILATLVVLGSSTAAMADSHMPSQRTAATVSVSRPVTAKPIVTITRPVVTATVSVPRPVVRPVVVSHPVVTRPERGHGPVADHRHPQPPVVIVQHPRPVIITQPVYQPVVYAPAPIVDNCNTSGQYIGPIGSLPDSYSNSERSLTEPTAIIGGREIINLGAQVGPIDTLVLQSNNNGMTTVQTVMVNFTDGGTQRFDVNETLHLGNPELTLGLGHRDVASLIVYGSSAPGATYQVLAS